MILQIPSILIGSCKPTTKLKTSKEFQLQELQLQTIGASHMHICKGDGGWKPLIFHHSFL